MRSSLKRDQAALTRSSNSYCGPPRIAVCSSRSTHRSAGRASSAKLSCNMGQVTIVEVIDLTEHTVIARTRFDEYWRPMAGGLIQHTVETDDGDIRLEVVELRIEGAGER